VRVLIADGQEVSRAGTRQILDTSENIRVLGETAGGDAALEMIAALHPDVALLDVQLSDRDGIDVAGQSVMEHPDTKIVILSSENDEELVRRALEAGVVGYLLKTIPREQLVSALHTAAMGTTVLDPKVSQRLARWDVVKGVREGHDLTTRERQIIAMVGEGLSNKVIAARLGLSIRTVEGHVTHIFLKLGVESRTELVRFAMRHGLL
jgi:NarL family two-component system response regulator LiaR